jgi:hypothetical protein
MHSVAPPLVAQEVAGQQADTGGTGQVGCVGERVLKIKKFQRITKIIRERGGNITYTRRSNYRKFVDDEVDDDASRFPQLELSGLEKMYYLTNKCCTCNNFMVSTRTRSATQRRSMIKHTIETVTLLRARLD